MKKRRILVIEDAQDTARMFGLFLEQHGYECEVVFTGAEGIAKAEEGGYDLILLDLMMSEINGLEVAESVRRRDRRTPILLVTGMCDDVLIKATSKRAGVNDVLFKPIELEQLLRKVKDLVEGHAS